MLACRRTFPSPGDSPGISSVGVGVVAGASPAEVESSVGASVVSPETAAPSFALSGRPPSAARASSSSTGAGASSISSSCTVGWGFSSKPGSVPFSKFAPSLPGSSTGSSGSSPGFSSTGASSETLPAFEASVSSAGAGVSTASIELSGAAVGTISGSIVGPADTSIDALGSSSNSSSSVPAQLSLEAGAPPSSDGNAV